jgi:hypothetical protein
MPPSPRGRLDDDITKVIQEASPFKGSNMKRKFRIHKAEDGKLRAEAEGPHGYRHIIDLPEEFTVADIRRQFREHYKEWQSISDVEVEF